MSKHFVEEQGVSLAWGRALQTVARPGSDEIVPLTVAITGSNTEQVLFEHDCIRDELDKVLTKHSKQKVETVANTIFPKSLWNPDRERQVLFDRYLAISSRLRKHCRANTHGLYFERMISNGPDGSPNQLEFALNTYGSRIGTRRSVLQVGVFDPRKDHSAAALRGFPCLQHLSFTPDQAGNLSVNAFYASQYLIERAYGNYLGICWLGRFVAHELDIPLTRVTCHIGLAKLDVPKNTLSHLLSVIEANIGEIEE